MNNADYYQCQDLLQNATGKLGYPLGQDKICAISRLITETMGGVNRYFHNFQHILMFANHEDPMIIIAALFHDLIYIEVDGKIPFNLTSYLTPFIQEKLGGFFIKNKPDKPSQYVEIALAIFGLNLGDNLSKFRGKNEFLSALCLAQVFDGDLPLSIIVGLMAMIELTIPFRGKKKDLTPPQNLEIRLRKVNQEFFLNLSEKEIIEIVIQGVKFANLDVSGFASENVKDFISNTWLLLPETNHFLKYPCLYTIQDYCLALIKTTKFFNSLSPQVIFHRYSNYPAVEDYQLLIQKSEFNLDIARCYFIYQVVSLTILQALITDSSGFIPLHFFFPESCCLSLDSSFVSFLPVVNQVKISPNSPEFEVIRLLNFNFNSPFFPYSNLGIFVTFVWHYLHFNNLDFLFQNCFSYWNHTIDNKIFLDLFSPDLIREIKRAIASFLAVKQEKFT